MLKLSVKDTWESQNKSEVCLLTQSFFVPILVQFSTYLTAALDYFGQKNLVFSLFEEASETDVRNCLLRHAQKKSFFLAESAPLQIVFTGHD